MAGFDRIKPPGQRVDEREDNRVPDSGQADPKGRAALFSASGAVAPDRPSAARGTAAPAPTDRRSTTARDRRPDQGGADATRPPRRAPRLVEPGLPDDRTPSRRVAAERAAAEGQADPSAAEAPGTAAGTGTEAGADARRADGDAGAARADGAPTDSGDPRLPTGKSMLQVECGHCGIQCPMPLGAAVKRAFPFALVLPTRSHPVFATCPCGERRTWLKPMVHLPR